MGRICKLELNEKIIETPLLLPVVNVKDEPISCHELQKEFGIKALMTNAYLLRKYFEKEVMNIGVHKFFDFNGIILTDSGAFQLKKFGRIDVSNEEIIEFQKYIKPDIGVILDTPTRNENRREVIKSVRETIKSAKELKKISRGDILWCGPIQGGMFVDLLKKSCEEMTKFNFDIYSVGIPLIYYENYDFEKIIKICLNAKLNLPKSKPLHTFGAGHPIIFSFLVLLGYDIFDSASYVLFAKDNRYMTEYGTKKLEELDYFPCNCKVCASKKPSEVREMMREDRIKFLAMHNLHTCIKEIDTIKQAIRENRLWELCKIRSLSHPNLNRAFRYLLKHSKFFEKFEPIRKRSSIFLFDKEDFSRPEIRRAIKRLKQRIGSNKVPLSLKNYTYPFCQVTGLNPFELHKKKKGDISTIREIADFQFGNGTGKILFPDNVKIIKSEKTGRIRKIFLNGKLIATLRARDGFFALRIEGAKLLKNALKFPNYRVIICNDKKVQQLISEGKNLFAKFVKNCDMKIIPREEVLVVDEDDNLIAVGEAVLNAEEMLEFKRGLAVKVREGII
ncbi:MAG: tRNA guanosine(15) transglycosylase TgtA [Candidatus Parvarchaeota archaeon]|nr:tRNA guanosine(15) transglycosylase TgtA [Candidatus Jingweiarchaeum tengchongense]MCW1300266.1 tRNA guanosine(15) transglycosylase TgtA [Candidatus Jingweiarchaeum tengchongense]MCW1304500.1 tRNA guanosine(15) transglycosylase TgtA [Candidatus Jingweiarchaeum tengchongense]MCW1305772.1 tRNA guanosine(15) transglycosylase TgtA [Candidatus Jingweiarchaeum tengchongense]MCW1310172.1 tRNA guanosine(15) transglycosylase TgtA [Candidatus Jingweiarchaeum tengchongense]